LKKLLSVVAAALSNFLFLNWQRFQAENTFERGGGSAFKLFVSKLAALSS
jgi:hypothetical protein